jgi:nucleoside phosphorylase
MEGAGILAAAERKHVPWLIVKAVCDYALNKGIDKKARQHEAAQAAARAVVHVLTTGAFAQR